MTNKNPYDDFYQESEAKAAGSDEMQQVDRGSAEIKIEREKGISKNVIAAGAVLLFALIVVGVFITLLVKKIGGSSEAEKVEVVENLTLARGETQTLANIQNKLARDEEKEKERLRLERERRAQEAREKAEREQRNTERNKPAEPMLPQSAAAGEPAAAAPSLGTQGAQQQVPLHQKKPEELTAEELAILRKQGGEVLAYQGTGHANGSGANSGQSTLDRPSSVGNMLITERHANGQAHVRASRKFLLLRGTNIPCTIIPRVITNYVSQPTCIVNEDIYSPEGIVLVDRGSKVIGEQRTAMSQGVKRVFIAWADIETPEGVSIKIDSMAADALGGSGMDAWIDNHWVERFGAAILLSFMDDLFEIIAAEAGKTEYNFENSTDNASSMGQIALENSIKIQPTGYIMPARQATIIVARDVDFTNIYQTR